jgi:hypothetical protein
MTFLTRTFFAFPFRNFSRFVLEEEDCEYLRADINSFNRAELEYYASLSEDHLTVRFPHINLCHRSAIGSSHTMQDCWYNKSLVFLMFPSDSILANSDRKLTSLKNINPYTARLNIRAQIVYKSDKTPYFARLGMLKEMFTLHLMDLDDVQLLGILLIKIGTFARLCCLGMF